MSILIKGMEMPTKCYFCPCADVEYSDCNLMPGTGIAAHGRLPDCPLVELPPHGRLIDADALMRHCVDLPRGGGYMPVVYKSYITNAPTIIEADEGKDNG